MLYLVHHTHIHLLPEARHSRHTRGMRLTHGLLYLHRVSVHDETCTCIQTQHSPTTLEDVCIGQEVHDAVILIDRHTLAIGNYGGIKLSVGQNNTFRITCCTTGIENIGDIIEGSFLLQPFHLNLSGQILTQLDEIAEINSIRIICRDLNQRVEHDDTLQRRTERKDATGFVVLVLFTHKEETYLGIVDHKLYLLLRRSGIERNGHSTNTPGSKVTLDILRRVL